MLHWELCCLQTSCGILCLRWYLGGILIFPLKHMFLEHIYQQSHCGTLLRIWSGEKWQKHLAGWRICKRIWGRYVCWDSVAEQLGLLMQIQADPPGPGRGATYWWNRLQLTSIITLRITAAKARAQRSRQGKEVRGEEPKWWHVVFSNYCFYTFTQSMEKK